jgi:hypothetical protein
MRLPAYAHLRRAVAPPPRGPDHPPRWQDVINAQGCQRLRHKPAEGWQAVTGCLIGAAEGRDFLMHARDRRMKVLNRRDATIKWELFKVRVFRENNPYFYWSSRGNI